MHRASTAAVRRRGSLIPAVAVALLVVGAAMALVLDRLWIDAARVELLTAAEAAALAGAAQLATDEQLRDTGDPLQLTAESRSAAVQAARQNFVAGQPLVLDAADVHIGQIVQDPSGRDVFLETDSDPTSVAVFANRRRSGANPVALFLREASGAPLPDVQVVAEASIDHRVVGATVVPGGSIPALPLAALEVDPSGTQPETWVRQIEERGGGDQFRYDEDSGLVVNEPDGLTELVLLSASSSASPTEAAQANVRLLDLGTGLRDDRLAAQIASGLSADDLAGFDGQLRFDLGPLEIACRSQIGFATEAALAGGIGQARMCFVYSAGGSRPDVAVLPRLVAARVMSVRDVDGDRVEVVLQAAVVSTRTALLGDDDTVANPYVCKLQLTQ